AALVAGDLSPSPSPARGGVPPAVDETSPPSRAGKGAGGLGPRILGLFSGGTLCSEAEIVLRAERDSEVSCDLIDLGDDRFTVGRPHPMIDPRDRAARIEAAATNPQIGVIL